MTTPRRSPSVPAIAFAMMFALLFLGSAGLARQGMEQQIQQQVDSE